jgi:hypothetical protein
VNSVAESPSVMLARKHLRRVQSNWAAGISFPPGRPDPLDVARDIMQRRISQSTDEGDFIRVGIFRYAADVERARWSRTKQIIERVQPGPFEDGTYLEFLARQAATIELQLTSAGTNPQIRPYLDRILLGTTGEPTSQAMTTHIGDASVITVSAGMVDLMYQVVKAAVLSWKPVPPNQKGYTMGFAALAENVRAVLDADEAPVRLIADALLRWLFEGIVRPAASTLPPDLYQPQISLLTGNTERFVIAHEYAHALTDQLKAYIPQSYDETKLGPMEKELRADAIAALIVSLSASELDSVAPNIALQGAIMAMKAHEIADRAIDIARGGDGNPKWTATTHPPFNLRVGRLMEIYRQVWLDPDPRNPWLDPAALHIASDTAEILWERARPQITAALRAGRRLHRIWSR